MVLFKRINGFNDYWINMNGEIYSELTNKILSPGTSTTGYLFIVLRKNNKSYKKDIHRLMGDNYLENPNNYLIIDHIDKNKINNNINNLRWTDCSGNQWNRIDNRKNICIRERNNKFSVEIARYKINKTFNNENDAIIFRNIILDKINNNEEINKLWSYIYKKDNINIQKIKNGKFNVYIKNKYYGTFNKIEEAKQKRDEILRQIL